MNSHDGRGKAKTEEGSMEANACDLCGKAIPAAPNFPEATACAECVAAVEADIN